MHAIHAIFRRRNGKHCDVEMEVSESNHNLMVDSTAQHSLPFRRRNAFHYDVEMLHVVHAILHSVQRLSYDAAASYHWERNQ